MKNQFRIKETIMESGDSFFYPQFGNDTKGWNNVTTFRKLESGSEKRVEYYETYELALNGIEEFKKNHQNIIIVEEKIHEIK